MPYIKRRPCRLRIQSARFCVPMRHILLFSPENTFPIGTTEAIKLSFQLKVRRLLPGKSRNLGINLYSKNGEYGFFFVSENEGVVGHWNVIENGTVRRKNGAWSSRDIKVIPKEGQTMKFESVSYTHLTLPTNSLV